MFHAQLPTVDHAESVGDEEVSLSLERSPVTPPMTGSTSAFMESSDIDLKEDGGLEPDEMVRMLKAELARAKAVRCFPGCLGVVFG